MCKKPREIKHILSLHGVVFAILFVRRAAHARRCIKPPYSLSTAARSGATVTTGDPQ
jgi:hypothetical protein